jgi:hypothetical protein
MVCIKFTDGTRILFDFKLIHLFAKCMQKKVIIRDFSSVIGVVGPTSVIVFTMNQLETFADSLSILFAIDYHKKNSQQQRHTEAF